MYHTQSNSFPMFFSMGRGGYDEGEYYSFTTPSASPSTSVDCTLSLGTPSTRGTTDDTTHHHHHDKKRSSCISNFGWNILPSKHTPPPSSSSSKPHRAATSGGDPLLARRCANCDTTSTPLWRNGPRGPKSLCNACGIRYKKEERRATAAAATSHGGDQHNMMNGSWVQGQKSQCYSNEYRFMEDEVVVDHRDSEIPFMSWRFNVTDRPGLIHDFTR